MTALTKICPPIPPGHRSTGVFGPPNDSGVAVEALELIPIDEVRAAALAEIAHRRWAREVSGIVVSGRPIDTGREARATLDQAARLGYAVTWKFADGSFAMVTAADLAAMVSAVMAHVAACYADEAAAAAAIMAADTFADVQAALGAFEF